MGQAYGEAIHKYPLFQRMQVPGKRRAAPYKKVSCPHAERAATQTICTLSHPLLLASRADLKRLVEAVAKIKENADELVGGGKRSRSTRSGAAATGKAAARKGAAKGRRPTRAGAAAASKSAAKRARGKR